MTAFDEYLVKLPDGQKNALERVRSIVNATVPDVEEVISYGMPTFKVGGKQIINMAAFKNHMSLFGNVDEFAEQLQGFEMSGKGTVQFTEENPIPEEIIVAMLRYRMKQDT